MTSGRQAGRAWLWLLLIVAAGAGVLGYWYYYPTAAPRLIRSYLPKAKDPTVLYRWQDAQGRWQVTDKPPPGRPYEKLDYWEKANVMPVSPQSKP
ncbi:MAG: DUF4124 domain-containing protein [Gammaproteobacteria bacterium]